jgi:hypothetical protein
LYTSPRTPQPFDDDAVELAANSEGTALANEGNKTAKLISAVAPAAGNNNSTASSASTSMLSLSSMGTMVRDGRGVGPNVDLIKRFLKI